MTTFYRVIFWIKTFIIMIIECQNLTYVYTRVIFSLFLFSNDNCEILIETWIQTFFSLSSRNIFLERYLKNKRKITWVHAISENQIPFRYFIVSHSSKTIENSSQKNFLKFWIYPPPKKFFPFHIYSLRVERNPKFGLVWLLIFFLGYCVYMCAPNSTI